jgi:hypothetical protein
MITGMSHQCLVRGSFSKDWNEWYNHARKKAFLAQENGPQNSKVLVTISISKITIIA